MKHRNMNQWVEVMVKGSIFFYLFTFLPLNTCAQPKTATAEESFFCHVSSCPDILPHSCGDARGSGVAS